MYCVKCGGGNWLVLLSISAPRMIDVCGGFES